MANHKQLREISKSRLRTSKILIDHQDYDGAFYMMGYVLECALKSVICKRLNLANYPDKDSSEDKRSIFRTHKFDILLTLSGIEKDFSLSTLVPARRSENWSIATKWRPETRYEPIGSHNQIEVVRVYEALTENPEGILNWISKKKKW